MNKNVFILSTPIASFFMSEYFLSKNTFNLRHVFLVLSKEHPEYASLCLKPWKEILKTNKIQIIYVERYELFFNSIIVNADLSNKRILDENSNIYYIHVANSIDLRLIKEFVSNSKFISYEHGISDVYYWHRLETLRNKKCNLIAKTMYQKSKRQWPLSEHVTVAADFANKNFFGSFLSIDQSSAMEHLVKINKTSPIPKVDAVVLLDKINVFKLPVHQKTFLENYFYEILSDLNFRTGKIKSDKVKVFIKIRPHSDFLGKEIKNWLEKFEDFKFYYAENYVDIFEPVEFLWPKLDPLWLYSSGLSCPYFLWNLGFEFEYVNTTKKLVETLDRSRAQKGYVKSQRLELRRSHKLINKYSNIFPKVLFL